MSGVPDVVGVARSADVGGTLDTGALYLWKGGVGLSGTPTTTFAVPGALASDQLGF